MTQPMRPQWPKLSSLSQKTCTLFTFSSLVYSLLPKDSLFKNIFDLTTAGNWDCAVAVECLLAFHYYSVGFIILSLGITDSNVEL